MQDELRRSDLKGHESATGQIDIGLQEKPVRLTGSGVTQAWTYDLMSRRRSRHGKSCSRDSRNRSVGYAVADQTTCPQMESLPERRRASRRGFRVRAVDW